MRDAKLMQIGVGTSEIQQHIIARCLLRRRRRGAG
jgi:alkylation response protein AidB-like acyl-CoA dehydrogenase